jgi:hypothetical protein
MPSVFSIDLAWNAATRRMLSGSLDRRPSRARDSDLQLLCRTCADHTTLCSIVGTST